MSLISLCVGDNKITLVCNVLFADCAGENKDKKEWPL